MKLQVGERLSGSGPPLPGLPDSAGGYVVTGVVSETPWHGLYAGKKVFYNFDFAGKCVRETDEKEWLDVLLRTIRYPYLDDADDVKERRLLARTEVHVLGSGGSNLWPEPVDLLELANSRDAFAFAQAATDLEPVVVLARASGQLLSEWRQKARPVAQILAVLAELLTFIEQAHADGLLLRGMGPASILIDRAQRVHYVGSDMVIASPGSAKPPAVWSKIFPPERYPRGFSAPECFVDDGGHLKTCPATQQADLYSWASLAFFLLTGQEPGPIAQDQGRCWADFQDAHFTALEKALGEVEPAQAVSWFEQLGLAGKAKSLAWPAAFVDLARRLLDIDPRRRPGSVAELRRWLVSPPPLEKHAHREHSPHLVMPERQAGAAREPLKEERLQSCPECKTMVPAGDLEAHLLTEHGICQFRGVRQTPEEMKATLLDSLCRRNADVLAGRMLEALAGCDVTSAKPQAAADVNLVTWVCQRLGQIADSERMPAAAAVAETWTAGATGSRLLPVLLGPLQLAPEQTVLAQNLTLEVIARQTGPVSEKLLAQIKPLLADRDLPLAGRQVAVVGLVHSTVKDEPQTYDLFQAYVSQANKMRALEQLSGLGQRLGKSAMLDRLLNETMDQVRMTCPSCGKQLVRKDMGKHVWDEHRLVLDGLSAREPWRLLEDWVVDYRVEKDPAVLRRCTDLVQELDGSDAMLRFQQLMLRHGVDDPETRAAVLARAEEEHATVCPRCFHLVPLPARLDVAPLTWDSGALHGHGYRLSISETGVIPRLTIEADDEVVYNGREPERWLTRLGGALVCFVPIFLVLFVLMKILSDVSIAPLLLAGLALVCALAASGLVFMAWPKPRPRRDRLIDAAWTLLVPNLLEEKLTSARARFLGALAMTSPGRGRPAVRADLIGQCLEKFGREPRESAWTKAPARAALAGLQITDLMQGDEDPFPAIVETIRSCLAGKNPLALLDLLLSNLNDDKAWGKARRPRLKLLLIEELFSAGIELRDLPDLAQAYPALGELLDVKNANLLVALRYLCSADGLPSPSGRARKPVPQAMTVFDMAGEFEQTEAVLNKYPGLLLSVPGTPIFLTIRGLWIKDVCLQEKPRSIEVHKLPGKDGYQLTMDQEHVWFGQPPDDLAAELRQWVDFYFKDLVPGIRKCPVQRGGAAVRKLLARNTWTCENCGVALLPRVGEVGVNLG